VQELELALEEERRAAEELRGQLTVLERKRIALQTELEDVRGLLEAVSHHTLTHSLTHSLTHTSTIRYVAKSSCLLCHCTRDYAEVHDEILHVGLQATLYR